MSENMKELSEIEESDRLEEESNIFVSSDSSPLNSTSSREHQIVAHGKEQLPPTDSSIKNKTKARDTESYTEKPQLNTTNIAKRVENWSLWDAVMDREAQLQSGCWSPWDDGIVNDDLPYQGLTKHLVDTCIDCHLYGPSSRERFTVFTKFCPDLSCSSRTLYTIPEDDEDEGCHVCGSQRDAIVDEGSPTDAM